MLTTLKGVIAKLQDDILAHEEDAADNLALYHTADAKAEQLESQIEAARQDTCSAREEISKLDEELKDCQKRNTTLTVENATLMEDKRKLADDLSTSTNDKAAVDEKLKESKATIEQMSTEKETLVNQKDTIEQQRDTVQKKLDDSLAKSGKLQHQLDALSKACADGKQELANVKKSRRVTGVERDEARKEVVKLKQSLADANQSSEERLAKARQKYEKVCAVAKEMLVA